MPFRRLKRVDAGLDNESGEPDDTAVLFDHCSGQIVDRAPRPPYAAGAKFPRDPPVVDRAVSGECALGRGDCATGILLVAQRDCGRSLDGPSVDDVHDLAAMGFHERPIDVVGRDRLDRVFFC